MMGVFFDRLKAAMSFRYTMESQLGCGGMSVVYLATDRKLRRRVAVKVLRPEYAVTLSTGRFRREIRIAARLQHPNILPVYDCGRVQKIPYYVMPYVEGDTLRERMNRDPQMAVGEALAIIGEVASGLEYAHRNGVIHRDIKPENILLGDGQAIIADFGIASARDLVGQRDCTTTTGQSLGTPHYMSPEQASGEPNVDARSDVYGLACVLYEMLAGTPPYTGPNARAVMVQHLMGAVPSIERERPDVGGRIDRAVAHALAKLPSDRCQSVTEFANALEAGVSSPRSQRSTPVLPLAKASGDA